MEAAGIEFAPLVNQQIEKERNLATPLSLARMCELKGASRAGFYRRSHAPESADLDAFSLRVVVWALDRTLEAVLVVMALRRTLTECRSTAGLVHHSDRGVQYACGTYTETHRSKASRSV